MSSEPNRNCWLKMPTYKRLLHLVCALLGTAAVTAAVGVGAAAPSGSATSPAGTWHTSEISQADAEATLRRYGLGKWIKPFRCRRAAPPCRPCATTCQVAGRTLPTRSMNTAAVAIRLIVAGSCSLCDVAASASKAPIAAAAVRAGSDSIFAVTVKTAGGDSIWPSTS